MNPTTGKHEPDTPKTDVIPSTVQLDTVGGIAFVSRAPDADGAEFIGELRELFKSGTLRPYDQLACDVSVITGAARQKQFAESAQEMSLGSALYYLQQSMNGLANMRGDDPKFRLLYVLGNIIQTTEVCQRVLASGLISADELKMVIHHTLAQHFPGQVSMPQAVLRHPIDDQSSDLTVTEMSLKDVVELVMNAPKLPSVTPSELKALLRAHESGVERSKAEEDSDFADEMKGFLETGVVQAYNYLTPCLSALDNDQKKDALQFSPEAAALGRHLYSMRRLLRDPNPKNVKGTIVTSAADGILKVRCLCAAMFEKGMIDLFQLKVVLVATLKEYFPEQFLLPSEFMPSAENQTQQELANCEILADLMLKDLPVLAIEPAIS